MARQPKPTVEYDPLAMARELQDAADRRVNQRLFESGQSAGKQRTTDAKSGQTDYRRTLFDGLFA